MRAAVAATTLTLLESGSNLSCVAGSRILSDLFASSTITTAEPVATIVTVISPGNAAGQLGSNPNSSTPALRRWTPPPQAGGFDGHVVVKALRRGKAYLLDPTIAQLRAMPVVGAFFADSPYVAQEIPLDWPSSERSTITFRYEGWELIYEHAPDRDFMDSPDWQKAGASHLTERVKWWGSRVDLGTALPEILDQAYPVATDRRAVPRNHPCPCGSGKKFKFCHGAG